MLTTSIINKHISIISDGQSQIMNQNLRKFNTFSVVKKQPKVTQEGKDVTP
jgi:hypothetical protein